MHNESFKICTPHPVINRVTESRGMRWVRDVACIGKKCMQGFCEDTWSHGRPGHTWEDNIRK